MHLMQVFKPKNFHDLRRILNVVSCNQISLGQKVKKKETELDGMVVLILSVQTIWFHLKSAPHLYCPVLKVPLV